MEASRKRSHKGQGGHGRSLFELGPATITKIKGAYTK